MGYPRAGSETDDPLTPAQSRDHPYMMNVARLYRRQHLCVREVIRSLGRFGEIDRSCVYPLSSCIPLSPSIHQLSPPNWGGGTYGETSRRFGREDNKARPIDLHHVLRIYPSCSRQYWW